MTTFIVVTSAVQYLLLFDDMTAPVCQIELDLPYRISLVCTLGHTH